MINSLDNHIEKSNDKYSLTINPVPFIPKKYYYLGNSGTCVRFLLIVIYLFYFFDDGKSTTGGFFIKYIFNYKIS